MRRAPSATRPRCATSTSRARATRCCAGPRSGTTSSPRPPSPGSHRRRTRRPLSAPPGRSFVVDEMLFDQAAEIARSLVPGELGELHVRSRRWALKAWFDTAEPGKEHYEAQLVNPRHATGAKVLGLEIGFHAEHKDPADNDECLSRLERG